MPEGTSTQISGTSSEARRDDGRAHSLWERMGVSTDDLQSLDRVLQAFGYEGNLDESPVAKE